MLTALKPVRIEREEDIVRAVAAARDRGTRVRAVGAGGSKGDNHRTDGIVLMLDRYRRLVRVDGTHVTVEAGMSCGELNRILRARGLALPTMGEWKRATVAGALSTGTHGGSRHHGILASSVHSLRLITGEGHAVEVGRDHAWFPHAGVSVGALGIVSTVTFACVEGFSLGLKRRAMSLDRFLSGFDRHHAENEFRGSVWIPAADTVITYSANRTTARAKTANRPLRFGLRTLVLNQLARHADIRPLLARRGFTSFTVDDCGEILTPIDISPAVVHAAWSRSPRIKAAEFVVPAGAAVETITLLAELVRQHPYCLANAVGLRLTAGDGFSLSPTAGRESLWFDMFLVEHPRFTEPLYAMLESMGARCHWGKHVLLSPEYLRRQYPGLAAFRALQARLDPGNLFANEFTERHGLTMPAGCVGELRWRAQSRRRESWSLCTQS